MGSDRWTPETEKWDRACKVRVTLPLLRKVWINCRVGIDINEGEGEEVYSKVVIQGVNKVKYLNVTPPNSPLPTLVTVILVEI